MFCRVVCIAVVIFVVASLVAGCPALVGGAVFGGAVVAHDQRTVGQLVEDEAIELKSLRAISADQELAAGSHINVTSFNGQVLLSGEVADATLQARATTAVEGVDKVARVFNELQPGESSSLISRSKDVAITAVVKSRMLVTRDFDATRVKVVTERGIVYLMGLVTRAEGDVAAEVARHIKGVVKVVKLFQYTG